MAVTSALHSPVEFARGIARAWCIVCYLNRRTRHQVAHCLCAGSPVKAPALAGRIQVKQFCHSATHSIVVLGRPNGSAEQSLACLSTTICLVDVECITHCCSFVVYALIIAGFDNLVNCRVFTGNLAPIPQRLRISPAALRKQGIPLARPNDKVHSFYIGHNRSLHILIVQLWCQVLDKPTLKVVSFSTATHNGHNLVCPSVPVAVAHIVVDDPISVLVTCAAHVLAPAFLNSLGHRDSSLAGQSNVGIAVVCSHIDYKV